MQKGREWNITWFRWKNYWCYKIVGILIDKVYDIEVAIIEVSGPNWKVDTNHFFKVRKKIAKNLKYMYKALAKSKTGVNLVSRKEIKL